MSVNILAGPWRSISLEPQSHDLLVMLKVGGTNLGHPETFFSFRNAEIRLCKRNASIVHVQNLNFWFLSDDVVDARSLRASLSHRLSPWTADQLLSEGRWISKNGSVADSVISGGQTKRMTSSTQPMGQI